MEPAAEESAAAAAAPDSWETADIDGPMSRLILSARRVSSSPDLTEEGEEQQRDPPAPLTQPPPQQQGPAAPSRDDSAAQVDQFLREALEKPRERLSGKIRAVLSTTLAFASSRFDLRIHDLAAEGFS
jgi:large subunit ribosomal protein L10Ae